MEQHPVPQHISSYEFRLVGDMTLRQFGYLAGGAIIGLAFYSLPIPGFIKWFLILTSCFSGFAFAFMPIEERPLTTWLIAFIKAIVSPTLFIWQKKARKPELFEPIIRKIPLTQTSAPPADRRQLDEYLKTLPNISGKGTLEEQEENSLKQIDSLFQSAPIPQITIPFEEKPIFKPKPEIPEIKLPEKPVFAEPKKPKKPFILPQEPSKPKRSSMMAKTSLHLPIPSPPTRANVLVGMVLDQKNEIIEGAILEIRNSDNMPVRALKTNKLGQFMIVTPLENGIYEIETEKEGHQFDIIKIEAKGEIIQPIEIKAK